MAADVAGLGAAATLENAAEDVAADALEDAVEDAALAADALEDAVEYAALAADALEDATVAAGEREASEDAAARRALTDKRGAVGIA